MKKICIAIATLMSFITMGLSPAFAYEEIAVSDGGSISGKVEFAGTPPKQAVIKIDKDKEVCGDTKTDPMLLVGKDGGIGHAVVFIEEIGKGKPLSQLAKGPSIDQKGCEFHPHILLMKAGTPLTVNNGDGILHNIKMVSRKNPPVNIGQPGSKKTMAIDTIKKPDIIKVNCSVHKWMSAWVVSVEHPYYAITDANGNFEIENIPPGTYKLQVWHEKLGKQVQDVTLKPKGKTNVSFKLKPKK